ncbi:glycosyltransferase [bacterium]|nr:glycosyltransferase [bacterium]
MMDTPVQISGFTIVRNAELLDFPFRESVRSALPLCDEFVINCGDSEDNTLEICEELKREFPNKIKIIQSVWERQNQTGGFQLKTQSDAAMKMCRGSWLIYIQADEVFHEDDYPKIRKAIQQAESMPQADGAQGFRLHGKRVNAIASGARVFHYGHVRNQESFHKKTHQMSQWWGETPPKDLAAFKVYRPVGLTPFTGGHPQVMREKIKNSKNLTDPSLCTRRWDKRELKNALTLILEAVVPFRLGEYRNYSLLSSKSE